MDRKLVLTFIAILSIVAGTGLILSADAPIEKSATVAATTSYIVQGQSVATVADAVRAVGGEVTQELTIINAVGAQLTETQLSELKAADPSIRIHLDGVVEIAGGNGQGIPTAEHPNLIGADQLWDEGITGLGVTVAVLDTGAHRFDGLKYDTNGASRILATYVVEFDTEDPSSYPYWHDPNGHGTHVAGIIVNSEGSKKSRRPNGVAPDANLVVVDAFDSLGQATYLDIIQGINWVVMNKARFDIRILNLSLSAPPRSHYWDDPMNQAVMAAWQAGIVVVASAGNTGPDAMTIGVPGNVPYVITVGAMSDNETPKDSGDDFLASFSAAGPTHEGFVKPELVAPGGHVVSMMQKNGRIATTHSEFHDKGTYFTMSGTSQAAAVVSGTVALMLQADPSLTPDDVKCRVMSSARPAVAADGTLAYSVFQQGAGMVDAYAAVHSDAGGCANNGMDINLDLTNQMHYGGRANQDENGDYYLMGLDG
ncbi:MAG: S8 family peptidase, partial [Gammaproteobacteria bacterium]|nr:S8 family peptidase [Gammaproteobacteria bacterium]